MPLSGCGATASALASLPRPRGLRIRDSGFAFSVENGSSIRGGDDARDTGYSLYSYACLLTFGSLSLRRKLQRRHVAHLLYNPVTVLELRKAIIFMHFTKRIVGSRAASH